MVRTNYSPLSTDSRANWIEDYTGEEHRQLVESCHAGQAEQYENEDR